MKRNTVTKAAAPVAVATASAAVGTGLLALLKEGSAKWPIALGIGTVVAGSLAARNKD
ncbi:MAG: hypothetical protein QM774_00405 [Gordonia sp. (in: high G+C Gram-positive bacteria)]|uniref:hypothetical protein n=1 Tax=Gordonia sp. (in: high G+C Gram-positive bacteria) TaxID=84139 RepID=UPI0039E50DF7